MKVLKHIKHQDINFEKWDKTIVSSQYPLVFAQSFYLNATCPQWDALVMGDYESVFPLTYNVKFGISYLHQPPFTPQLGVYGRVTLEIEKLFFDHIKLNFKLIEIELNAANALHTSFHKPKTTFIIDYKLGYKFNQNTKRNISKAIDNKLSFIQIPENDILNLSKIYLNPFLGKGLNLSKQSIHLFNQLLSSAIKNKNLYSFNVVDENNKVHAIAHFISNGKHTVYLKGINFDKEVSLGSMHLLNSSVIQFFETKCDFFDFGGGSKESLVNFYKGFGALPLLYNALIINKLPWIIKLVTNKK